MRVVIAVVLALGLILSDSAARLILIVSAPHLAHKVIPDESKLLKWTLTYEGYYTIPDYSGGLYHIHDNERFTANQPAVYTRTVWIFGNSGAFGFYVSDAETMESRIQTLLNGAGYHWRVVNKAVPGATIASELAQIKATSVKSGDLVVFDDGGMDLVYGYYDRCVNPRFAVLELFCRIMPSDPNAQVRPDFERISRQAQDYAIKHGITFYHFIQPTPYTALVSQVSGIHLSVPDDSIMDAWHLTPDGEQVEAREIFDTFTLI